MEIIHTDNVISIPPNTSPNYDANNPLLKLMDMVEKVQLAEERQYYYTEQVQYLFPISHLSLYGPSGSDFNNLNPLFQDNKTDFQKQNVQNFITTDTFVIRGIVRVGDWSGPFLRISYRGGPDSKLSSTSNHQIGERIKLWIKVGKNATENLISVPYNSASNRYEVELWGYDNPDSGFKEKLSSKGKNSMDRGELQFRGNLVKGNMNAFKRDGLDDKDVTFIDVENVMHPVLPLHIELAWTNEAETVWDSQGGKNYHYEFNMILRGWDNYLGVGLSPNPHGGVGFLEYRNLLSNYGRYTRLQELSRKLEPWNFNAYGNKNHLTSNESFMAVDYMDLHILKANCGIGLHRHRDNQEVFFLLNGRAYMVIGDWCKMPERERCIEVRSLREGHFAMLKGGNLHGLMNPSDENISLFMLGGYD